MDGFRPELFGAQAAPIYDRTLLDDVDQWAGAAEVEFFEGVRRRRGPTRSLLELGAGSGRLAIPLARHGWKVIAQDISEHMLRTLASRAAVEQVELS